MQNYNEHEEMCSKMNKKLKKVSCEDVGEDETKQTPKSKKRKLKLTNSSEVNNEKDDTSKNVLPPLSDAPDSIAQKYRRVKESRAQRRQRLKNELKSQTRQKQNDSMGQKSLKYLETWQEERSLWKYNKNTNMYLLRYFLNCKRIPDSHFPILMEYFRSAKGNVITRIKENAVLHLENKEDDENEMTKMMRKRAKEILSLFD